MAFEHTLKGHTVTLPGSGDLSGSQYKIVAPSSVGSSQVAVVSTRGARFMAVLQDGSTAAGQDNLLAWGGITKVEAGDSSAGSAINIGDPLMASSAGRAVPSTGISQFAGLVAYGALTSGNTGIIPALITLGGQSSS